MRYYLKELRETKNLTQQVVAKALGISQHYYSTIESGKRQQKLGLELALKLSTILNVPLGYIVEQENLLHGKGNTNA